jgi:hypothetical protein
MHPNPNVECCDTLYLAEFVNEWERIELNVLCMHSIDYGNGPGSNYKEHH